MAASTQARLISLVLPVYDEEASLRELYRQIIAVVETQPDRYELVFVDDGSRDGSIAILEELQRNDSRVRVVELRRNFGKAAAYSAGFDHARGEIVVTMDTDLQDDPAELPGFIEKIDEGFDMVAGWKHEGKGSIDKAIPSRIFNLVVRRATGIVLHDFNCPFKAYRKEVLDEIHVYGELHRFIPVLAASRGFTMTEIKIKNLPRVGGVSKYGFERHLRGLLDFLTIIFTTRFAKRPMHLLGLSGVVACGVGFSIISFLIAAHFLYELGALTDRSWVIHDRPALSLSILLMVVGVQFFSIGLIGELFVRTLGSVGQDRGYSTRRVLEEERVPEE